MKRRNFLATLLAPILAKFAPKLIVKQTPNGLTESKGGGYTMGVDPAAGRDYLVQTVYEFAPDGRNGYFRKLYYRSLENEGKPEAWHWLDERWIPGELPFVILETETPPWEQKDQA